MGICRIDVHVQAGEVFDHVIRIVKAAEPFDYTVIEPEQRDRRLVHVYMRDGPAQALLDNLQSCLEKANGWRITVASLDVTLPKLPAPKDEKKAARQQHTREEIYVEVSSDARLNAGLSAIFLIVSIALILMLDLGQTVSLGN